MRLSRKHPKLTSLQALWLAVSLALAGGPTQAMDTDIFTVRNNAGAANVLIVLDNTSNWARQNQHWPGGIQQGQAEVEAIKTVINNLPGSVNVGLMEYPAKGNANDNGGYIRFAISPVGQAQSNDPPTNAATNRANFSSTLTTIYNDINGTTEKQNSNMAYGNFLYDAYNYFAGASPFALSDDVATTGHADSRGYLTNYTRFKSPLSADTSCANNYIIFIGNPNSSGPASDDAANTAALVARGGSVTPPLSLPLFTQQTLPISDKLGYSSCIRNNQTNKTPTDYAAACAAYDSCSYDTSDSQTASCSTGEAKYQVLGNYNQVLYAPTSTSSADTKQLNADEWARLMYQKGVPVSSGQNTSYQTISTYTIDVYNAQPNPSQSGLLSSMATASGGRYFSATNQEAIVDALTKIFAEIQAVNTAFASASLPISATNRAQNDNQVYIGMFRPDPKDHPRWFGNLKRYQLAVFNGVTDLAGVNVNIENKLEPAINPSTGFITPCAVSWWTADSGNYWANVTTTDAVTTISNRIFITEAFSSGVSWQTAGNDTDLAKGLCGTTGIYSDLPDGPIVEKGGAAQMLRQQNSRNVKTLSGTNLVDFNTTNVTSLSDSATVNSNIVNFIRGLDVTGEIGGVAPASPSAARPSIHGDVVHSRPLPVDYGGNTGVYAFYGAGDGTYHAVNATTGVEAWAFVAPESYSSLLRLLDNSPLIQTPWPTPPGGTAIPNATPKSFYFDGSTGLYQNADNSKVWIYPAMRRGGRMLYAFDVHTPASPTFKWKVGCPNMGDDTGCTSDNIKGIGQTWSTPSVAFLSGYDTTTPVLIVGGGYDTCEDADSATPSCSNPKGAHVYVLNADTGDVLRVFDTDRSVAGDVTLVDINQDGKVDAAYVATTGGSLYRIDFSNPNSDFAALTKDDWTISKVAYTTGYSRKFLFAPSVLTYKNKVYLAIGSGDREHPLSASYSYTSPVTNRFYVYLDDPVLTRSTNENPRSTNLDGSDMLNKTNAILATCDSAGVLPDGAKYGWYMDLTGNQNTDKYPGDTGLGEQTVTSSLIIGGMATFSTNRPVISQNSCTTTLGEARGYWVNLINGSGAIGSSKVCGGDRSAIFVGGGLPPSPVAGKVAIGGKTQVVVIGAVQRDKNATSTPLGGQQVRPPITAKRTRTYWKTSGDTH